MSMKDVIRHYDLLIAEGNDPVHDPEQLRAYMDQWDGEAFLQAMMLDGTQSVLEIGVGTGRLAVRTAPLCSHLSGIDLSRETVARAGENLAHFNNVTLMCGDFLSAEFAEKFDVIYSSLTFMHIREKARAIEKIAGLLSSGGRAVLSLDKNQSAVLDYGTRQLTVYPDDPAVVAAHMEEAGLKVLPFAETKFANIVTAVKA